MEQQSKESHVKVSEISLKDFTRDVRQVMGQILRRLGELEDSSLGSEEDSRRPLYIRFDGHYLEIQNTSIPLYSRPLSCRLIGAFFQTKMAFVPRRTMIESVYNLDSQASVRLKKCAEINLNKLVSRTRQTIEEALVGTCWAGQMDWLVYDSDLKSWQLFVMRSSPRFLLEAERFPSLILDPKPISLESKDH